MTFRLSNIGKAILQLGLFEISNYIIYHLLLKTGLFQFITPKRSGNQSLEEDLLIPNWFNLWENNRSSIIKNPTNKEIINQADLIVNKKVLLFGNVEQELDLNPHCELRHWSRSRSSLETHNQRDIKQIWEPARFSWAIRLAQAFFITKDEKYAICFWERYSEFSKLNPLNCGPNWQSGQEIALRLIALVITINLLHNSKALTHSRISRLSQDIVDHANRIIPTLSYAKAQNNNHLLSEAVGLFTAGNFLPNHPHSKKWKSLGVKWFETAIKRQILNSGAYIQQSCNYHRMMLTLALWMKAMLKEHKIEMESATRDSLSSASNWLIGQLDPISGQVPNLGHNDGSLILPFSTAPYSNYRPIAQATSIAFLGKTLPKNDNLDDLSIWLGFLPDKKLESVQSFYINPKAPRIGNAKSWANLRTESYAKRPAHADQLHVDLWYQGNNIALDAGTYKYNSPPPWNNGFAATSVHNTLMVNGKDQMTRAGRFLWLDWAQGHMSECNEQKITSAHDGYLRDGIVHQRNLLKNSPHEWTVSDNVIRIKPSKNKTDIRLHWLLPDWPIDVKGNRCTFSAPFGSFTVKIALKSKSEFDQLTVYRAGKKLGSNDVTEPLLGWYSPTYDYKIPAISIELRGQSELPASITTQFIFQ